MSFLTIPTQEGLFTAVKSGRAADGTRLRPPADDEDNGDDDDDDEDEDVRFIPRCSPVPRKRGSSIHDETAEYMRIHRALCAGKRVSFADTTGGDLVDVKEFVAFDSDEEEDAAKWEEEEAKYRPPQRRTTYRVQPEFRAPGAAALLRALRDSRVEVEQMYAVEDEPLACSGLVRVLNVSFHKAVYIRSTMDGWASYFDHPADYVQGSHDGDTDRFSFKLSFAPPYTTHGSRIEFVVRYETSDGDFWANNSSMNYAVTLLVSYEDTSAPTNSELQPARSILKPPKAYSSNDESDSEGEQEEEEDSLMRSNSAEAAGTSRPGLVRPTAVCPALVQPEIDVEIALHPSGPSVPPNPEFASFDGALSAHTVSPGGEVPCTSSETTLQSSSSSVLGASDSAQPDKSQPFPELHSELGSPTSEQPIDARPSVLLPSLQPESRQRSESAHAGGEEIPSSEASCVHLPTTEKNLWPTARHPCLELPAECISAPGVTEGFEREAAVGLREDAAESPAGSSRSADRPPAAERSAAGDTAPSPDLSENTSGVTEVQSVSAGGEQDDAPQVSPDTLLENRPNALPQASELQPERDVNRNPIQPSVMFLSGVVALSVVMQEPRTLFFIGLLLVLNRM